MKRLAAVSFFVALLTAPATTFAQGSFEGPEDEDNIGITGTVHAGPSLFFDTYDSNTVGFNVDVYPGYEITNGISAELNLGFRSATESRLNGAVDVRTSYIPAFVPGVRYHFPLGGSVEPYLHFHLGLGYIKSKATGNQGQSPATSSTTSFTVNYGAGVDVWLTSSIALSGGVTMRHYFADIDSIKILDFNLGMAFKF